MAKGKHISINDLEKILNEPEPKVNILNDGICTSVGGGTVKNEGKHTMGKWFVGPGRIESDDGTDICYLVVHAGIQRLEDKPNAKLIASAPDLLAENQRLKEELETERMKLAACGVAALGNNQASKKQRIISSNPYYSASYQSVCAAVDREINLREVVRMQTEQLNYFCLEICREVFTCAKKRSSICDVCNLLKAAKAGENVLQK